MECLVSDLLELRRRLAVNVGHDDIWEGIEQGLDTTKLGHFVTLGTFWV